MTFASELSPQVELLRDSDARPTLYFTSQFKKVYKTLARCHPHLDPPPPSGEQIIRTSSFHNRGSTTLCHHFLVATPQIGHFHATSLALESLLLQVVLSFFPQGRKTCSAHYVAFLLIEDDTKVPRDGKCSCLFGA